MKLRRISAMLAALCVPFAVQTASAEKIVVGSECTYPPFEYVNDGKIEGYDIDIMNAIGKVEDSSLSSTTCPLTAFFQRS